MGILDTSREEMIQLLRERGITDEQVLRSMNTVPRERFIPEPFDKRAYEDSALPIGRGQTISQPYTVAFMTQALQAPAGGKVLEIGTGSGYQAAVLAEMGFRVFSIEREPELLSFARRKIDSLGYRIATKGGDGTVGWSEYAPYSAIVVTAGAPGIPDPLLDQLEDGGRLVIPVGNLDVQTIMICTRRGDSHETEEVVGFKFVPLIGKKGWK
ncbi:MAG: protein-L-isoaspartate(D-aspartate) O-methyltransferase [Ignavibacteria bacterium]|nr:protein-L-isoaspartate(D-aspartate) O-methyltransferase [Ignavibacteria bacterium]